VQRSTQKT